jgi:hypothetical protein
MDVDLNITRPLLALLEDRHASSAAERCGVLVGLIHGLSGGRAARD